MNVNKMTVGSTSWSNFRFYSHILWQVNSGYMHMQWDHVTSSALLVVIPGNTKFKNVRLSTVRCACTHNVVWYPVCCRAALIEHLLNWYQVGGKKSELVHYSALWVHMMKHVLHLCSGALCLWSNGRKEKSKHVWHATYSFRNTFSSNMFILYYTSTDPPQQSHVPKTNAHTFNTRHHMHCITTIIIIIYIYTETVNPTSTRQLI